MNRDTITLPRSVVEQALAALFMYKPMVTGVTFQHGLDAMQELRAALEQPQVEQEPVAHSIVAGALFDFMGWLTSRRERLVLSSTDDAASAADAIKDFAKMRSLSISDAQVQKWQEHLSAPQPPRQPLTNEEIFDAIRPLCNNDTNCHAIIGLSIDEYRAIERAHGIGGEK